MNRCGKSGYRLALLFLLLVIPVTSHARPVVNIGFYDFKPLVFRDDEDRPAGLFVDVINYVARKHGWQVQYHFGVWPDNYQRLLDGDLDLIPCIAATEKRKELFDFSQMLDGNLENVSNVEGSSERMNYEIAKHITGLLLTVEPVQIQTGRYAVIKGDTVASITRKFQISIADFMAMNPGLNPTRLEVGQMVKVSNPTKQ